MAEKLKAVFIEFGKGTNTVKMVQKYMGKLLDWSKEPNQGEILKNRNNMIAEKIAGVLTQPTSELPENWLEEIRTLNREQRRLVSDLEVRTLAETGENHHSEN